MKKLFSIATLATSMLLVVHGTSSAGPQSPGGITGGNRLRPGTWNRSIGRSAPYRVQAVSPAQPATDTYRSFSYEPGPGESSTAAGTTCCTPMPTCCAPVPSCVESSAVAPPNSVPQAPSGEMTQRSYSFEPQPAPVTPVYRPQRSSSRVDDRMYRKLHPGSGWRP